jgi:hypothetical protein
MLSGQALLESLHRHFIQNKGALLQREAKQKGGLYRIASYMTDFYRFFAHREKAAVQLCENVSCTLPTPSEGRMFELLKLRSYIHE